MFLHWEVSVGQGRMAWSGGFRERRLMQKATSKNTFHLLSFFNHPALHHFPHALHSENSPFHLERDQDRGCVWRNYVRSGFCLSFSWKWFYPFQKQVIIENKMDWISCSSFLHDDTPLSTKTSASGFIHNSFQAWQMQAFFLPH